MDKPAIRTFAPLPLLLLLAACSAPGIAPTDGGQDGGSCDGGTSVVDELPTAVLEGCLPSDAGCSVGVMSVSLAALTTKQLIMSGKESIDTCNASLSPISAWRFRLVRKPANAAGAVLQNDGVNTTQDTAILSLDPTASGLYTIALLVWDDHGQQSPQLSELTVSVAP